MKIAAIICEYNPFHNGHLHQLEYIRKNTDADRTIAIMSGDFVQRGEPALFSKEARTHMALASGVDAVFLLPVSYSTGSAELFALGGVTLAAGLGADYLVFGSESGDINELTKAALRLRSDGRADSPSIKRFMSEGHTFAKARALAFPEFAELISCPNNILALEYIMAAMSIGSGLKPITHRREGSPYEEGSIIEGNACQSATALRELICSGGKYIPEPVPDPLGAFVPGPVLDIIREETAGKQFVKPDDLSDILYSRLLFMEEDASFSEVSEDLLNRIKNSLGDYNSFTGFADTVKAKNLTRSGIMRALCHIMLGLKEDACLYKDTSRIHYARLLGFREEHADLLSHIKSKGTLEMVSKVPDVINETDGFNRTLFEEDRRAAMIYEYVKSLRSGRMPVSEYSKLIIRV